MNNSFQYAYLPFVRACAFNGACLCERVHLSVHLLMLEFNKRQAIHKKTYVNVSVV